MMKKLLAMLLAALMLISACAVAEEAAGGKLVIRDVVINLGDETLDLSGIGLTLAMAGDEAQGALNLAVDAAGTSVLNAIAAFDAEQLTLRADGISDVYALSYEDLFNMIVEAAGGAEELEAFVGGFESGVSAGMSAADGEMPAEVAALVEHAAEIIPNSISDGGTTTIDGVEYTVIEIDISEEQMDVLLDDVAAIADVYAADNLKESGYDSYAQLFDEQQLRVSVNGAVYAGETDIIVSIDMDAITADMSEPETVGVYAVITSDAENGVVDVDAHFYTGAEDAREDFGALTASYVEMDGEFAAIELSIYDPADENSGAYLAVYAPSVQENGLWQFSIGTEDADEPAGFHIVFGNADGQDQFTLQVVDGEEVVYIDYLGADGVGTLSAGMMDGEEVVGGISATVEVAEDDGAWLPAVADDVVDMLTIDDAQMEKLSDEGITLLLNALASLSEANESLAAMLEGM